MRLKIIVPFLFFSQFAAAAKKVDTLSVPVRSTMPYAKFNIDTFIQNPASSGILLMSNGVLMGPFGTSGGLGQSSSGNQNPKIEPPYCMRPKTAMLCYGYSNKLSNLTVAGIKEESLKNAAKKFAQEVSEDWRNAQTDTDKKFIIDATRGLLSKSIQQTETVNGLGKALSKNGVSLNEFDPYIRNSLEGMKRYPPILEGFLDGADKKFLKDVLAEIDFVDCTKSSTFTEMKYKRNEKGQFDYDFGDMAGMTGGIGMGSRSFEELCDTVPLQKYIKDRQAQTSDESWYFEKDSPSGQALKKTIDAVNSSSDSEITSTNPSFSKECAFKEIPRVKETLCQTVDKQVDIVIDKPYTVDPNAVKSCTNFHLRYASDKNNNLKTVNSDNVGRRTFTIRKIDENGEEFTETKSTTIELGELRNYFQTIKSSCSHPSTNKQTQFPKGKTEKAVR